MRHAHVQHAMMLPLVLVIAIVLGLVLDIWYPAELTASHWAEIVGIAFIFGGTVLLVWGQQLRHPILSRDLKDDEIPLILRGSYRLTRYPTEVGMLLMAFGLASLLNSLAVFLLVLLVLFLAKIVLLPREDFFMRTRFPKSPESRHKK